MARTHESVLRNLLIPFMKEGARQDDHSLARAFFNVPSKKLEEILSVDMKTARTLLHRIVHGVFLTFDRGDTEALEKALAAAYVYDREFVLHILEKEVKDRKTTGKDDKARKIIDYARESGRPVKEMKYSSEKRRMRRETDAEAAARHLETITYYSIEERANNFRVYRQSMVDHGFFNMTVGSTITTAARKKRADDDARRAAAKVEVKPEPKKPEAKPTSKPDVKANKPEQKSSGPKPATVGDLVKAAQVKLAAK